MNKLIFYRVLFIVNTSTYIHVYGHSHTYVYALAHEENFP